MIKKTWLIPIGLLIFSLPFLVFATESETPWYDFNDNGGSGTETGLPSGTTIENPQADPGAGTYTSTQSVTLITKEGDHNSIRYTTDDSEPACPGTGTLYEEAININSDTILKAIACYASDNSFYSDVVSFEYVIEEEEEEEETPPPSGGGGGGGGTKPDPAPADPDSDPADPADPDTDPEDSDKDVDPDPDTDPDSDKDVDEEDDRRGTGGLRLDDDRLERLKKSAKSLRGTAENMDRENIVDALDVIIEKIEELQERIKGQIEEKEKEAAAEKEAIDYYREKEEEARRGTGGLGLDDDRLERLKKSAKSLRGTAENMDRENIVDALDVIIEKIEELQERIRGQIEEKEKEAEEASRKRGLLEQKERMGRMETTIGVLLKSIEEVEDRDTQRNALETMLEKIQELQDHIDTQL